MERRELIDDIFQRHGNGPRFATQRETGADIDTAVGHFVSLKNSRVPLRCCAEIRDVAKAVLDGSRDLNRFLEDDHGGYSKSVEGDTWRFATQFR